MTLSASKPSGSIKRMQQCRSLGAHKNPKCDYFHKERGGFWSWNTVCRSNLLLNTGCFISTPCTETLNIVSPASVLLLQSLKWRHDQSTMWQQTWDPQTELIWMSVIIECEINISIVMSKLNVSISCLFSLKKIFVSVNLEHNSTKYTTKFQVTGIVYYSY